MKQRAKNFLANIGRGKSIYEIETDEQRCFGTLEFSPKSIICKRCPEIEICKNVHPKKSRICKRGNLK